VAAVGLVVVSHSRALGEAAADLGREVLQGGQVRVEVAAGLDDGSLGTDATAVLAALERAEQGDGVVVLMDLGSAVLSAELALDLLDEDARGRVVLSPAPLVEGLVAACVAAAGGADREAVAAEASAGLGGKQAHLGDEQSAGRAPAQLRADGDAVTARVPVTAPHGLHARPAARLVQAARAAALPVEVRNATTGSDWVSAASMSQVAVLGVLHGHELELRASGPGARAVVDELLALADRGFEEATDRG
jgi:dihydroxyacetone kinase phosphotransfer subunit